MVIERVVGTSEPDLELQLRDARHQPLPLTLRASGATVQLRHVKTHEILYEVTAALIVPAEINPLTVAMYGDGWIRATLPDEVNAAAGIYWLFAKAMWNNGRAQIVPNTYRDQLVVAK